MPYEYWAGMKKMGETVNDSLKGQCHGDLVIFQIIQKPKNVFGLMETVK